MIGLRFPSLYRRIFILYITFFLVLSLLTLPLNRIFLSTLEKETIKSSQEVLENGLIELETELDNVFKIGSALYSDLNFYRLTTIAPNAVEPPPGVVSIIRNLQTEYQNFYSLLNIASDFGMVLPNSMVLSPSRVHMPGEDFYGKYFQLSPYATMEEWVEALKSNRQQHLLTVAPVSTFTGIQLSQPRESLVFAVSLPLTRNWRTFCYAILPTDAVCASLALEEMLENGELTLTDETGSVLIHQSRQAIESGVSIQARSDKYRLTAHMSINRNYFHAQMENIRRLIRLFFAAYLLAGIALVIFFTLRNGKPMVRVLHAANAVDGMDKNEQEDAYAYMERFIHQVDSRLKENRLALANQEILIKENLMERMLRQQLYFSHSQEMARTYFPDFPLPCQMALIRLDESSRINELPLQRFSNLQVCLRRIVSSHLSARSILHFTAGSLVVLQPAQEQLCERYRPIIAAIAEELDYDAQVCISLPFDTLQETNAVFMRLRHMLRFSLSTDRVILEDAIGKAQVYEGNQHSTRFYEMLSRGRLPQALEALDDELAAFRQLGAADESSVQQLFYAYRMILCRMLQYGSLSPEEIPLPAYDASATLDQLFSGVRRAAGQICEALSRRTAEAHSDQEAAVLSAIEGELSNPSLGIEFIMERFSLSEKRAQQLMRSATGMTFFEYLNHKRMERAKALLEETDIPIQEVSASCGYASVNTFYKAFQRAYAMAPNAMRKKARA